MGEEYEQFGSKTPFAEPPWYDSRNHSAFYNKFHVAFRNRLREFVDTEVIPHVEDWEKAGIIPREAFIKASQVGLLQTMIGWPEDVCGPRPEGFDGFFLLIAQDEISRCASGIWCKMVYV